eukprot:CAMPEP_0201705912 /NCGR_PEP_ID=MMETSP0578-20130828/47236_1 /ASSEMBLY_ACC=CAM_ASM_000663 /TAXON_ID=267565 /ORGANISM="Skeletonema grethea, Strain CCMP 1804" /LENGTH=530 /DNA_ID=CAMNT_0048194251 /DNA_START=152 /DNA_END=1741 /DNA_ORIENTATION=+
MSSQKNSSRSSIGSSDDHRMAETSQDQYEVDHDDSQHDWFGNGDGVFSSSGTQVTRNLPSPTRLARTARINRTPPRPSAPPPQPEISYSTPKKKKSNSGGVKSTPDTIASTPSSSFSSTDDISPVFGRSSGRSPSRSSPRRSPRGSPRNSRTDLVSLNDPRFIVVDMDEDEVLARRLDQELRDAEFAASLERAERAQNLAQHRQAAAAFAVEGADSFDSNGGDMRRRDGQDTTSTASSTSCRDKSIYWGIRVTVFAVVTGVTLIVLVLIFGGPKAVIDPNTWMPGWPDGSNPNDVGKVGEHNMWVADLVDNGLNLIVLNSLDRGSDWNDFFRESISDWDNGTPDSVTLKVRRVPKDPECTPVRRTMKVCNGDYGPTDWRGVNQIILANDFIISSVAKMNDYYLEGTNRAQKLYTMCHEIGHGLGLGHFDENFYNKDLGNCMDYTETPENNMHPDESNFMVLKELYGNVNQSHISSGDTVAVEEKLKNNGERQLTLADEQHLFDEYAKILMHDPIEVSDESGGFPDVKKGW